MTDIRRLPTLPSARGFLRRPPEWVLESRERYGDRCFVKLGPVRLYFFHDPADVEEILVGKARELHKDQITIELRHSVGRGLLTTDGDEWKRRRRVAAPTLTRRQIEAYADDMVRYAREAGDAWPSDATRDVHHDMMALTLRVVARTLFATELEEEVQTVGAAMDGVMADWELELNTWRRFVPRSVPLPNRRAVRRHLAVLDETIRGLIAERRQDGAQGDDLMSRLIRASDADTEGAFSDQDLLDEAKTFFAAGHETTAIALTMAIYFASLDPAVGGALDAELNEVLGDRDATLEDLPKLRMTEAVVKETLRLHPPAWIVGRENAAPITIGGAEIPAGAQLLASAFAIHRDPRWWRDPERFDPQRWFEADDRPRFAYLPFGGGPRVCIGNHFAMMESVLMLATLWQRLRFELAPGYQLERLAAITMRPRHGMPMRVVAR